MRGTTSERETTKAQHSKGIERVGKSSWPRAFGCSQATIATLASASIEESVIAALLYCNTLSGHSRTI